MKDKDIIVNRIEKIKRMSDPNEAIAELADLTLHIGEDACEERKEMRKDVRSLRVLISGNGNPAHSILTKIDAMNGCFTKMERDVGIIKSLLVGDISAGIDNQGLIARVQKVIDDVTQNEREVDLLKANQTKVMWIIITAVVVQVLASIFL
jgi:hypothetical protein